MHERIPDSDLAVETVGLCRHFGDTRAVDGVDLAIPRGMVYGLLGPNGAGKTTTIRMLATLLRPTSGVAKVMGYDIADDANAVRACVSLTGQFASVDEDLSGLENLILLGRLVGFSRHAARARASELLDAFGLADASDRRAKQYSGGMRRRLDIAASLIVAPRLLFLDEPTTGLDPRSRNQVWAIIRSLAESGTSVLLTTQHLDEADQLAERIAVIDHGKVIAEGTAAELKSSIGTGELEIRLADRGQCERAAALLAEVLGRTGPDVHVERETLTVLVGQAPQASRAVQAIVEAGIEVASFSLGQPSLDEVFLALTDTDPIRTVQPAVEEPA